jgi:nucleoid DNA-binding protein
MKGPEYQSEVIRRLALKYNKSYKEIADIVYSQFSFVKKIMEKGDHDTIRIMYLGAWSVNPKRVEMVNKKYEANNN